MMENLATKQMYHVFTQQPLHSVFCILVFFYPVLKTSRLGLRMANIIAFNVDFLHSSRLEFSRYHTSDNHDLIYDKLRVSCL